MPKCFRFAFVLPNILIILSFKSLYAPKKRGQLTTRVYNK